MYNQNDTLEQLSQKLVDAYKQCEDYRENNTQLLVSKQQLEEQVEAQLQQLNSFHVANTNEEQLSQLQQYNESLTVENQQLQMKLHDMEQRFNQIPSNGFIQRIESPREVRVFHFI